MKALSRGEWVLLTVALSVAVVRHRADVSWGRFAIAFAAIDLVGYLPGALAQQRARGALIAPVYHALYNATHNFLTASVAAGAWALAGGGPEWAMLALPIHLAGDRGVFGNGFKPSTEPFEPAAARS
jgi:hypothetical protein